MVLDSVKKFCPKALLPFLAIVFIYSFAGAQEARFFDEIRDVPIPPGFEELAGEGYSYDKPQGRIVEAVAGGPAV